MIFRLKVQNKISTRTAVNRLSLALMGWTFDAYFICHMHAKTCTCNCIHHNFLIEAFSYISYSVEWSAVSQSLRLPCLRTFWLLLFRFLTLYLYSDTDIFLVSVLHSDRLCCDDCVCGICFLLLKLPRTFIVTNEEENKKKKTAHTRCKMFNFRSTVWRSVFRSKKTWKSSLNLWWYITIWKGEIPFDLRMREMHHVKCTNTQHFKMH